MQDDLELSLRRLASEAGVDVNGSVLQRCADYVRLLTRWNARMNLTALPLAEPIPDNTLNKLVIEPLVGAQYVPVEPLTWFDLGSGGGSPALPLRLARPAGTLTMVEARSRKCAFLREAARVLRLQRTEVRNVRFEDLNDSGVDFVTVRAVRVDPGFAELLTRLLRRGGTLLAFGSEVQDARFTQAGVTQLPDRSVLRVFHVEH